MWLQEYLTFLRPLFASDEELQAFVDTMKKPLKKTIKILHSRIDQPSFDKLIKNRWRHLTPTQFEQFQDVFYIDRDDTETPLGKTFLHLLWFFYMQELAASVPAHFVDIPDNGLVLDMCAAPWGKTVQLADYARQNNTNTLIVANEMNARRIPALWSNITRTAMYNTIVTKYDGALFGKRYPELFDAVLLDAPCSWEWTAFKSDSSYRRRKPAGINKIARLQQSLLVSAVKTCKVWGSIVFSTCTLNPIENEKNILAILKKYPDVLELEDTHIQPAEYGFTNIWDEKLLNETQAKKCLRCWPHKQWTGGFFVAKFRKKSSVYDTIHQDYPEHEQNLKYFDISSSSQKQIKKFLADEFAIQAPDDMLFVRTPKYVYATIQKFADIRPYMACDRVGVPVLKWSGSHDRRPTHIAWLLRWSQDTKRRITLTPDQVQTYVQQEDISFPDHENGYYLLQREWYGVWVGKIVDWVLKNKFVKVI